MANANRAMMLLDECIIIHLAQHGHKYQEAGDRVAELVRQRCPRDNCNVGYVGKAGDDGWIGERQYHAAPRQLDYVQKIYDCYERAGRAILKQEIYAEEQKPSYVFKKCMRDTMPVGGVLQAQGSFPPKSTDDRDIMQFAQRNKALIISCDSDDSLESSYSSDRLKIDCERVSRQMTGVLKQDTELMADAILAKLNWLYKGD